MAINKEFQAIFSNVDGTKYLGEVFGHLKEALEDHAPRAEETQAYLIGVRSRRVEPWAEIPLSDLIEAKGKK